MNERSAHAEEPRERGHHPVQWLVHTASVTQSGRRAVVNYRGRAGSAGVPDPRLCVSPICAAVALIILIMACLHVAGGSGNVPTWGAGVFAMRFAGKPARLRWFRIAGKTEG